MAATAASSSTPAENDKPVIVRVKRKASQSRIDAFWLEINERPLKRPLLDFEKLSISDSSTKVEELKSRKVFVRHVETVTTSEVTVDILQTLVSNPADEVELKGKNEIKRKFKTENKQEKLLSKAKEQQEISSKNARFEQIWRSRKQKNEYANDDALQEMCRLYDVVRVDVEKKSEVNVDYSELEDSRMMSEYLPLLREALPSVAVEIEADIFGCMAKGELPDKYVYDYYAVQDDMDITEENAASPFPLLQVEDDDCYDGPDDSEYETDDSNAENNPLNDYPDEQSSDVEDDVGSKCSEDDSEIDGRSSCHQSEEAESISQKSVKSGLSGQHDWSEDEMYDDYDGVESYDYGDFSDLEEWR
ncbi:RNA-directed DNA methylation 4 [Coffea eugenioides]|uniref:RNA-directed DNA methylation 4 n=1 Tax=Coffea eugenioides TaxID=49369 RepID=UPI000F611459|nr:RNA-directed DNA methylation 4 [Coffea eugenioides]